MTALTNDLSSRRLAASALRWLSALATLVAVVLLFRAPLAYEVLPNLDRAFAVLGVDRALRLGPAPGFQLRAGSIPAGAELWIDGVPRGTLPLMGNVICRAGRNVVLEVRLDGHETWRREVVCREAGQLDVTARLKRSR